MHLFLVNQINNIFKFYHQNMQQKNIPNIFTVHRKVNEDEEGNSSETHILERTETKHVLFIRCAERSRAKSAFYC